MYVCLCVCVIDRFVHIVWAHVHLAVCVLAHVRELRLRRHLAQPPNHCVLIVTSVRADAFAHHLGDYLTLFIHSFHVLGMSAWVVVVVML